MSTRDLEAEIDALRARQAWTERCLAGLLQAVEEITDEIDPQSEKGRDLARVFGAKIRGLVDDLRANAPGAERNDAEPSGSPSGSPRP